MLPRSDWNVCSIDSIRCPEEVGMWSVGVVDVVIGACLEGYDVEYHVSYELAVWIGIVKNIKKQQEQGQVVDQFWSYLKFESLVKNVIK